MDWPPTLSQASAGLRDGSLQSRDLLHHCLRRISESNEAVKAVVHVRPEGELEREAAEADARWKRARPLSALDGIPIGLKDVIDTAGIPTESGSRVHAGRVPTSDAPVIRRLREAGALITCKTRTHEFCYGAVTPPARNPYHLDRIPGGSSGGSGAALAAGMVLGALGTDTGGSIRIPAALNGVAGLRPSYGLVPNRGVTPIAWTLDTVGPMAASARDLKPLLEAIAGHDPADPSSVDVQLADGRASERVRLGVAREFFCDGLQPSIYTAFEASLRVAEDLGWDLVDVTVPLAEHSVALQYAILVPEATAVHDRTFQSRRADYGAAVRAFIELGYSHSAVDYIHAQRVRATMRRQVLHELGRVDAIATPTTPSTAPAAGPGDDRSDETMLAISQLMRNCVAFGHVGLPSLTIPCGVDDEGLPIGIQLSAAPYRDLELISMATTLEEAMQVQLHPLAV